MALIFLERENPPTALFWAQQKSAELGLHLAGLQLTSTCRLFTCAIMLETEAPTWLCNYSFCRRGQNPPPLSFPLYSLLQDHKASLLFICVCLSDWLDLATLPSSWCQMENSNLPSEGDNSRCWYISLVFYVLLSSGSYVEIEIFLF